MLHLFRELHASEKNAAVLATAYDWKGLGAIRPDCPPPLDPPMCKH